MCFSEYWQSLRNLKVVTTHCNSSMKTAKAIFLCFLEIRNTTIHLRKSLLSAIFNCHTFNCKLTCSFLRYELMFWCCSGCQTKINLKKKSVKSMLVVFKIIILTLMCYLNICVLQQFVFDNKIYTAGYFYMQMRTLDEQCFSWVPALFLYLNWV